MVIRLDCLAGKVRNTRTTGCVIYYVNDKINFYNCGYKPNGIDRVRVPRAGEKTLLHNNILKFNTFIYRLITGMLYLDIYISGTSSNN